MRHVDFRVKPGLRQRSAAGIAWIVSPHAADRCNIRPSGPTSTLWTAAIDECSKYPSCRIRDAIVLYGKVDLQQPKIDCGAWTRSRRIRLIAIGINVSLPPRRALQIADLGFRGRCENQLRGERAIGK